MKQLLFVPLLFLYGALLAESAPEGKIEIARFKIIKRTVEFLATDKETFKQIKATSCTDCTNDDKLLKFISDNGITGADLLVVSWGKIKVDNDVESWHRFFDTILKKVTTGAENRVKRTQLATYSTYRTDVEEIIAGVATSLARKGPADTTQVARSGPKDNTELNEEIRMLNDSVNLYKTLYHDEVRAKTPDRASGKSWIYLGGMAACILLALYSFMSGMKERKKKERLKKELQEKKERLNTNDDTVQGLKNEIKSLKTELSESEERFEKLSEKRAAEMKTRNQELHQQNKSQNIIVQVPVSEKQKGFEPVIKYARYADQGDGFTSADLLDKDDNETIFEITITAPGVGIYRVIKNQQAQKYALSNASYFLSNTCLYDSLPSVDSIIITNTPGELMLQGDKWKIRNPARISFN
jgi:hypothetical protein